MIQIVPLSYRTLITRKCLQLHDICLCLVNAMEQKGGFVFAGGGCLCICFPSRCDDCVFCLVQD